MKLQSLPFFAGVLLLFSACGGDFRQPANSPHSEVLIVMDTTRSENPIRGALSDVYGEYIRTMPRPEPRFDLRFRGIQSQAELQQIQKHRNIIIAAPIDEDSNIGLYLRALLSQEVQSRIREGGLFEIPLRDRWYRDQWILIYTGNSEEEIAARIRSESRSHLRTLSEIEIARWDKEVYRRGETKSIGDSLWVNHGFRFRVQHDYVLGVDTLNFVSMRRFLEDNDRWIWIWWKDNVQDIDFVSDRWIHATRDSILQQYIRGSRPDAYVRTDYRQPLSTDYRRLNERLTYESKGVWVMSDFSMGGPFINYTKFDEAQQRLYMIEFAQFSPRYRQRRFLYQFEAMARTFETNPSFVIPAPVTSR
jgi:hypothetical protein